MRTIACIVSSRRSHRLAAAALALMLAGGCAALRPTAAPNPPAFYSLDIAGSAAAAKPARTWPVTAPTLVVSAPRAAAGFDSSRMIYVRQAHKLEYFAHNEWIDTPARMLSPLIIAALENAGAFRAVVQAAGSAGGELRLDTEVLTLQQEFIRQPSRVRFTLRAQLVEDAGRRVVASREFEAVVAAPSDDPYGGVTAANQAVRNVLQDLAVFCAQAAAGWRPAGKSD